MQRAENYFVASQRLADILGIDWRDRGVTGFTVRCRAGMPLRLTVSHVVDGRLAPGDRCFELRALDGVESPAPWCLESAVAAAMARLADALDADVDRHLAAMRRTGRSRFQPGYGFKVDGLVIEGLDLDLKVLG